jgi:UDP-N-acetylmuramate--alanine ligase
MIASEDIQNYFFLGIGGIGMSALARYFHHAGAHVCGYDRTPSPLTKELEAEGIWVTYEDDPSLLRSFTPSLLKEHTLIVRTPAVPEENAIYTYFREHGYQIMKRAEVLGLVTRSKKALCVAGTHGKTTTSTMLAHLMHPTNAFLGGISMNYDTNLLLSADSPYVVVEADEYDRSFHHLTPYMSVVTAVDADHLDIYGTAEAYRDAFAHYTSLITGALVMKHGIALQPRLQEGVKCYTYGVISTSRHLETSRPDFYADNIRVGEGTIDFDFHTPNEVVRDIHLGVPVWVNIENSVAAMSVAWLNGVQGNELRSRIASFQGVLRRFNIHVHTNQVVYIDDYAHHPQEIASAINSIRKLFPQRRLIGVFQPHLFTRTRDFADGFASVLSTLDEVILLPIYPAREEPIEGVNSEMLASKITNPHTSIVPKAELVGELRKRIAEAHEPMVVLTVGAGDIDRLVPQIADMIQTN